MLGHVEMQNTSAVVRQHDEDVEHAKGLVVVSQTCDVVRACTDRHFVEVSPLIRVDKEVRETQLEPSAKAKRPVFTNNDLRVLDGPFSESKELIDGFAVLELSEMDEAIAMCRTYAAILGGTLEIDVRPLGEPETA